MGIIVCSSCDRTIDHVDSRKVTTYYSVCPGCAKKRRKR